MQVLLDGKKVEYKSGETILDVARRSGIEIPTLCHQTELKPFASCFICVVETKGLPRLVPSCSTVVTDGMDIETGSEKVRASRKVCVELLLSDHCGDCRAPCQVKCPAGIDIPGFISLLAHSKEAEAIKLIKENLPLPASLGRVCPRPCETECRRACVDDAVSICFLKRYIADKDLESKKPYIATPGEPTGKKVAIVGAGPSGLSAAFFLKKEGHSVTIFDAHKEAGGMLRYGIPAYRLPRDLLSKEISLIEKMGVEFKLGRKMGRDFTLDGLRKGYDAVYLAIGAQSASDMRVEGEREGGSISGIAFLEDIAENKKINLGSDVYVVGGGNTAIDAARTSLRLGAKNVTILYRRSREEMPANAMEVKAAEDEGVVIQFLTLPTKMEKGPDGITLTCVKMKLGEPDASGRRKPIPIEGSEFKVKASAVISAIGQGIDTSCLDDEPFDIKLTKWNGLEVNEQTFETSVPGIFAGGDCVSGADIAVTAIASGKKAAASINQFLRGEKVTGIPKSYLHSMGDKEEVPKEQFEGKEKLPRTAMPELPSKGRTKNFKEVETGFSSKLARKEAERCLSCGCRSFESCTLRKLAVQYDSNPDRFAGEKRHFFVDDSHPEIHYEGHKCILCGSCVRVCSEVKKLDALGFVKRGFVTEMKPIFDRPWKESTCDSCMKCVPMCPTGAISLKVTPADEVLRLRKDGVDASKIT